MDTGYLSFIGPNRTLNLKFLIISVIALLINDNMFKNFNLDFCFLDVLQNCEF